MLSQLKWGKKISRNEWKNETTIETHIARERDANRNEQKKKLWLFACGLDVYIYLSGYLTDFFFIRLLLISMPSSIPCKMTLIHTQQNKCLCMRFCSSSSCYNTSVLLFGVFFFLYLIHCLYSFDDFMWIPWLCDRMRTKQSRQKQMRLNTHKRTNQRYDEQKGEGKENNI